MGLDGPILELRSLKMSPGVRGGDPGVAPRVFGRRDIGLLAETSCINPEVAPRVLGRRDCEVTARVADDDPEVAPRVLGRRDMELFADMVYATLRKTRSQFVSSGN